MINNFQLLKPLIQFSNPGDCYFVQFLKRHKDNPDMTRNMVNVDNLFIYSEKEYEDMESRIIDIATLHNTRAYIRVNRRNTEVLALKTNEKIAKLLLNKDYKTVKNAYLSAAGEEHSEPIRRWLVDIDTVDAYPSEIIDYIKELHIECNRNSKQGEYKILLEVPTRNGLHIICNPFNLQKFRKRFPDPIDVHKDNPTILYHPDPQEWNKLASVATPDKWIEMYKDYSDMLTKEDVGGWWQEQYVIADKERTQLKSELYLLKQNKSEKVVTPVDQDLLDHPGIIGL